MKKNLRLVWCQIDVDGGGQHRHFEHDGGMAVPRRVVRILRAVVLPQQLTREKKKHIRDLSETRSVCLPPSRHLATTQQHVSSFLTATSQNQLRGAVTDYRQFFLLFSGAPYLGDLFVVDGPVVDVQEGFVGTG